MVWERRARQVRSVKEMNDFMLVVVIGRFMDWGLWVCLKSGMLERQADSYGEVKEALGDMLGQDFRMCGERTVFLYSLL